MSVTIPLDACIVKSELFEPDRLNVTESPETREKHVKLWLIVYTDYYTNKAIERT